jgi:riboflavin biosynthesis pyrimidine reductase
VEVVEVSSEGGHLCLPDLLSALRARKLSRIFIEGGGITVSHFLQAGLLHRLHVVVAPMILGSGTPALQLDPIDRISDAITTRCRHFALGPDVLFDCAFER